jgi:hypothetical protein
MMEKSIIKHLEASKQIHDVASLLMISKLLSFGQTYENAKKLLIDHSEQISPEDARRIGVDALYQVMIGRYNKSTQQGRPCGSCNMAGKLYCKYCGNYQ